jgi:outer membrane protein assembly factor BamD
MISDLRIGSARGLVRGAMGLTLSLGLVTGAVYAQEPATPPASTAPASGATPTGQDANPPAPAAAEAPATPTPTVATTPGKKTRTRKSKEDKVVASKDTKKDQKQLSRLKKDNPLAGLDSSQPDKQLYDKALASTKRGRYDVARLELQTLLATYPDSEYMMRAKLAFADSWYREGGTAALAQAETEYKDFITFFPNAPEAAEAQMRVGDIYFKQMDTPDRDYTKAVHAQEEYRTMLQQFPDSTLIPGAKQRLREVQEVLATRETNIAAFYAGRENWPASIARYQTVVDTYPLFSHSDEALIGLGDAFASEARMVRLMKLPEGAKARLVKIYEDQAAAAYGRVVTQYSASAHVEDARDRLETIGRPIPTATADQIAASQALESSRQSYRLKDRVKLLVFRGPDTVQASKLGEPALADPKPTLAPTVTRQVMADFSGALNPNAPAAAAANTPATTTAAEDAAATPAAPAAATPLALSDVPSADAAAAPAGAAVDMAAPASSPASSGTGVGVEILTPGATKATEQPNGLTAVGPANTEALPAVEKPSAAPDQINEVAGEKTPVGQAAPAKGKPKVEYDKGEASSSKHRKKKGLNKINPF